MAPSRPPVSLNGRIEFRPPYGTVSWIMAGFAVLWGTAVLILGLLPGVRPWDRGAGEFGSWLALGLWPAAAAAYLQLQVIWIDSTNLGLRRGFVRRVIPRQRVHRIVGHIGRILYEDRHGTVLLNTSRLWSDDQVRAICDHLGVHPEGIARTLEGPLARE